MHIQSLIMHRMWPLDLGGGSSGTVPIYMAAMADHMSHFWDISPAKRPCDSLLTSTTWLYLSSRMILIDGTSAHTKQNPSLVGYRNHQLTQHETCAERTGRQCLHKCLHNPPKPTLHKERAPWGTSHVGSRHVATGQLHVGTQIYVMGQIRHNLLSASICRADLIS